MGEDAQLPESSYEDGNRSAQKEHDAADARFGLDLMADGAWKVMLGLEVLRDHQELFEQAREALANTEYWVRQLNQELDELYDILPDPLVRND